MHDPKLNRWYCDERTEERFEVIEICDDYITAHCIDGSVLEYSKEEWFEKKMIPVAAPQDWELSWDSSQISEDLDERFEAPKRHLRLAKEEETEDFEDFSFSDDLDDLHDLDSAQ